MRPLRAGRWALAAALAAPLAQAGAEMAVRQWRPRWEGKPPKAAPAVVRFDLSGLAEGTKVHRADLRVGRTREITGRDEAARIDIEIRPLWPTAADSGRRARSGEPLRLRAPWFDRFDATAAVRTSLARGAKPPWAAFRVKALPHWDAGATRLEVAYEGAAASPAAQVRGLRVVHRAGQTFVLFREIDDRSCEPAPLWADLKKRRQAVGADPKAASGYRVWRHDRAITAESLPDAEWLADVPPLSAYNVRGRSVDQLICLHRRRAIDDLDFAKRLAAGDYFTRYHPDMPEMGEVAIGRLAVEPGKPLPPGMGLYVHHPRKAGKAYYAVATIAAGEVNTRDFSSANSLAEPVAERVGPGEPVLQGEADVSVFFDYPGKRLHYVQWAAPPRAHLPNQYYNWSVFVPRGYERARVRRLSVFFHDARQRYLKPPWPHRRDTVLLAPHDAPYRSYGYGYHEALGTLRSFGQGKVRPFFAARVDAVLDWAVRTFGAAPGRVSCGGRGYWGGTAAIQYGVRRPGRIAYVMAEDSFDPDPRQTPYEYSHYGRGDRRKTDRGRMDAVWGQPQWKVLAASGEPIWRQMDLVAYVRSIGARRALPYLSLGAGSMHVTWKQETQLMKAYLATHNAFMAEFFWGSRSHKPLPVTAEGGDYPFEPRADRPILACTPRQHHPNPKFFQTHFETGRRGYSSGSRLNTRPRWRPEQIVDAADRLEMTVYSARRVVYAGRVTCDVVVRNTSSFKPKPGEKLLWSVTPQEKGGKKQDGTGRVDASGHIHLTGVQFGRPGRLVVRRAGEKGDPQ